MTLGVYSSPYPTANHDLERPKYKGPSSMDCRKRGSHAREVCITYRMPRARGQQE